MIVILPPSRPSRVILVVLDLAKETFRIQPYTMYVGVKLTKSYFFVIFEELQLFCPKGLGYIPKTTTDL